MAPKLCSVLNRQRNPPEIITADYSVLGPGYCKYSDRRIRADSIPNPGRGRL
jgi:hypothetical protein